VVDAKGTTVPAAIVHISGPKVLTTDSLPMAVMDQVDREYTPHLLPIYTGQQVSFPNSDNVRHHIYSFSKTKPFEIKLYANTLPPPLTFSSPGEVILGCNIHDSMLGYIIVYDGGKFKQANSKGSVSFDEPQEQISTLTIWHPDLKNRSLTNLRPKLSGSSVSTIAIDLNPPPVKISKKKSGRFYK